MLSISDASLDPLAGVVTITAIGEHMTRREIGAAELRAVRDGIESAIDALDGFRVYINALLGEDVPDEAEPERPPGSRLIPVSEWGRCHRWPSKAAWHHMIRARAANGLEGVVLSVGGRWIVDEAKFLEWVRARDEARMAG